MTADTQNNRKVTEKSPLRDTKRCKSFFCLWEEKSCENNYGVRKIKAKSLVEKNNIKYIFNTKTKLKASRLWKITEMKSK